MDLGEVVETCYSHHPVFTFVPQGNPPLLKRGGETFVFQYFNFFQRNTSTRTYELLRWSVSAWRRPSHAGHWDIT